MRHLVCSDTPENFEGLGGKIQALARLSQGRFNIPAWVALRPQAFYESLSAAQKGRLEAAASHEEILSLLAAFEPRADVRAELSEALKVLCPDGRSLAVRSSAAEEDSAEHSFAGQLESFLRVPCDLASVIEKVIGVWRSGFSQRVWNYRRERGLSGIPAAPAVLIQRMVHAQAAGVAFSADPVSGRHGVAVVAAVRGLGEALVSGERDADTYRVDLSGKIVERQLANDDPAQAPALGDAQVRAVAALARSAARFFQKPQDIEWAVEGDQLYLLQSRPITSLAQLADPDDLLTVWDNSNIAESYGGITTPLTFSFARRVYEEVYRQFCKILKVPKGTIQENDDVFARMLGLIRGRVYYNLLSWYRVLALLPGFQTNRTFMEQMMGVKESLSDELLPQAQPASAKARLLDRVRLSRTLSGLASSHFSLGRRIRRFYERLNDALGATTPDLSPLRPDELVATYRRLQRRLLTRWDAPLVNDFFAMIFYGLLRKLCQTWCGDLESTLQNNLLLAEGGMISAEPAKRLQSMAQLVSQDEALVDALRQGPLGAIERAIERSPSFKAEYVAYLDKFGDRCLDELKLESLNLSDDPLPVLRAIGQLAHTLRTQGPAVRKNADALLRREAEQRARQALGNPVKRMLFNWVLKNARARVRDRENLRFERTRVFGRVRLIFVELGRRFYALGLLDHPRDVFYLEIEEALGMVEGTTSTTDLKGLAAVRKAEFAGFERLPAPADRFRARGIVHRGNPFENESVVPASSDVSEVRKGIGCCPGKVQGTVRVVRDPRSAALEGGSILVAERTDPSWIMLFPFASGVLVERGSLLSHAAIVSRELGIPSVVAIDGLTRWLKDGDVVEFDGATGVVRRLNGAQKGESRGQ